MERVAQGESYLRSISNGPDKSISKKISSLESLGFSPTEINEVLKRLGTSINVGVGNVSNLTSLMLNNVIPSLIILGTGALVFFLTGGEDEIIEPLALEEDTNIDGFSGGGRSNEHENGGIRNKYADQTHEYDGEDSPSNNEYLDAFDGSQQQQRQRLNIEEGIESLEWVKELQLKTDEIALDVKAMKEALLKLSSNSDKCDKSEKEKSAADGLSADTDGASPDGAVSNDDVTTESDVTERKNVTPLPILTVEDYLNKLRTVVREMSQWHQRPPTSTEVELGHHNESIVTKEELTEISNNDSKTSGLSSKSPIQLSPLVKPDVKEDVGVLSNGTDDEGFKLGCGTLMMYVSKVLEQPSVPRYRKISTSNASFKSLVQPLEGHIEVLSAVGFKRNESGNGNLEWTWRADADQIVSKGGMQRPDEGEQTVILTECVRLLGIGRTEGSLAVLTALDKSIRNLAMLTGNDVTEYIDPNGGITESSSPIGDTSSSKNSEDLANILGHEECSSSITGAGCEVSKPIDKKSVTFQKVESKEESVPALQEPNPNPNPNPALQEPSSPTPPLGFSDVRVHIANFYLRWAFSC